MEEKKIFRCLNFEVENKLKWALRHIFDSVNLK